VSANRNDSGAVATNQMDTRVGFECKPHGHYDTNIVTQLVVILTDFLAPDPDDARSARPRLPVLEEFLSRSDRTGLDCDWRGWLAARCAPAPLGEFSLAAVVGAAFRSASSPKPDSTGYWLATPVHFFAGLDSVRVHPDGLLLLTDDEQCALVTDFARVFSDSPWRLESLGQRELLLSGLPMDANGDDPGAYIGADPSAGLPRGERAGMLRRLGAEMEMWLYEHPVNQARVNRGELPVTTLWLWGAQAPGKPAPDINLVNPQLYGSDVYAQALWQLQDRQVGSLSDASQAINAVPIQLRSDSVLLYPSLAETGMIDRFTQLERSWLPGAMRALRQGRLSRLRLIAGTRLYTLTRFNRVRFWRARTAWWEQLA
jgi:hypothetical protein